MITSKAATQSNAATAIITTIPSVRPLFLVTSSSSIGLRRYISTQCRAPLATFLPGAWSLFCGRQSRRNFEQIPLSLLFRSAPVI